MTGRGFGRDITRLIAVLFFCLTLRTRKIYILLRLQVRRMRMLYAYCTENVWKDPRNVWYVRLLKIVNLSVKSFFDKNIQTLASFFDLYDALGNYSSTVFAFSYC